jgi:gas vesicle protein
MTKQELRPFWLGLTAGAAVAAVAGALFFANSETVLRKSFQTALNRTSVEAKQVASAAAPISGSEDFWLTAMRDGTTPVNKTISVGDQISMNLGGVRRTLEVATVADFSPQITQIDTSSGPSHLVLVTAHDLGDTAARPIRFVMEIQQRGAPVVAGRSGRTL